MLKKSDTIRKYLRVFTFYWAQEKRFSPTGCFNIVGKVFLVPSLFVQKVENCRFVEGRKFAKTVSTSFLLHKSVQSEKAATMSAVCYMPSSFQASWEWQNGDESQQGKLIDWLVNRLQIIFISFRRVKFFPLRFHQTLISIPFRLGNQSVFDSDSDSDSIK